MTYIGDAVSEQDEVEGHPALCPCGKGYEGHDPAHVGIRVWRAGGATSPQDASGASLPGPGDIQTTDPVRDERRRWAKWAHDLGYPFDFTNREAIPEPDMIAAIAEAWHDDPAGFASESMEDTILSVCYEIGLDGLSALALTAWWEAAF